VSVPPEEPMPRVAQILGGEGLIEAEPVAAAAAPGDLTRTPISYPAPRDLRLQALARGDEGFLLAMSYSTQRGYGHSHPFAAEIRQGKVTVELVPPELGFAVEIGEIAVTECQMVNQFKGNDAAPPQFTSGYGLSFGGAERKAMAMALVDRALRAAELGEEALAPAQDQEFVLSHADNVEASGFVQHLKLPHYVDFQSELDLLRRLRREWTLRREAAE
jgi:alpha-D-ribose 1-methylphosphonate 5-triphosphate synthase subunit PhnI